jgi:hypothetical protein
MIFPAELIHMKFTSIAQPCLPFWNKVVPMRIIPHKASHKYPTISLLARLI